MRTDALGLMQGRRQPKPTPPCAPATASSAASPAPTARACRASIDSGTWQTKANLADAFLNWGQYAYGAHAAGTPERARFAARLRDIEAVVHNQDNREHDLLDCDDYYQFEGGLVATAEALTGRQPAA